MDDDQLGDDVLDARYATVEGRWKLAQLRMTLAVVYGHPSVRRRARRQLRYLPDVL
ncbi:hypothetical protein ACFVMC_33075 [Nocardia sp. NPDC127579]|uniref:hypothetical protein n=1 Tax=Nocardia sp. NPDC127579 TaxID=3345402 RepID=UPI00362FC149